MNVVLPVRKCNPKVACCADLKPAPDAKPHASKDAFVFGTKPVIVNPFARSPETPVDWSAVKLADVQRDAFSHHSLRANKDPAVQQDREFAQEIQRLTDKTASGLVYSLGEKLHLIPRAVIMGMSPEVLENPYDYSFTWAWQGNRPNLVVFKREAKEHVVDVKLNPFDGRYYITQASTNPVCREDDLSGTIFSDDPEDGPLAAFLESNDALLWGGSAFLLGSVSATPNGGAPRGARAGLPVRSMLFQGGIGAGMLLGIHTAVTKLGVPKQLAPYVDVGAMVGVMQLGHHITGAMAESGIIFKQALLPKGYWGSVFQSSPYFALGSIGVATALDALGCKFGSTCNTLGTITGTTFGYVGISETTSLLTQASTATAGSEFAAQHPRVMAFAEAHPRTTAFFSRLGHAYEAATGVGLEPATVNIGSRSLALGSRGSGIFYAAGGPAGGAGWLSGGIQALGAFGAVALGSWLGGGIVDFWAWYSGNSSSQDFKLIDLTWNYMNQGAAKELGVVGKSANFLFGPVVRGIQSLVISDHVWQGMTEHWQRWSGGCNDWAKGMDKVLLSLALASTTADSIEGKQPRLRINMGAVEKGLRMFFTSKEKPAGCKGNECMSNAEAVERIFDMIALFESSAQRNRLKDNTLKLYFGLSRKGKVENRPSMKKYLHNLIRNAQENKIDDLYYGVRNLLSAARKQYASRMVQLKLMRKEGDKLVGVKIRPRDLNAQQKAFLFGGEEIYAAVAREEIKKFSDVRSEYIVLRKRINALEYMLRVTKIMDQSKAPSISSRFSN